MNLVRLEQDMNSLPPEAQMEVMDFIAFLKRKYRFKKAKMVNEEAAYWTAIGEASLRNVWDNEEDDVYNELLKR